MARLLTEAQRTDMMTQGVRDLFAASWLGEQMFAQLGLHRAVDVLADPRERTKVIGASWRAERPFGRVIQAGLAGVAIFDIVRSVQHRRFFDLAASGCALAALGTAIGCELAGKRIGKETPIETGFRSSDGTPDDARRAQLALKILAPLGLGLAAASIGLSIASRSCDA